MDKQPDSSPAFPTTTEHGFNSGMPGMTLLDYFAGKALNGICAHPDTWSLGTHGGISKEAYLISDAMMAERTKRMQITRLAGVLIAFDATKEAADAESATPPAIELVTVISQRFEVPLHIAAEWVERRIADIRKFNE